MERLQNEQVKITPRRYIKYRSPEVLTWKKQRGEHHLQPQFILCVFRSIKYLFSSMKLKRATRAVMSGVDGENKNSF